MLLEYLSNEYPYYILFCVLLIVIGYIATITRLHNISNDISFSNDFRSILSAYIDSSFKDVEKYNQLLYKSYKMQTILGTFGILHNYRPQYENITINQCEIISNLIPEINRIYYSYNHYPYEIISIIDGSIVRYLGYLDEKEKNIKSKLINPFKMFPIGLSLILNIPLYICKSLGLIPYSLYSNIKNSPLYQPIAFIIALLGILSDAITVSQGGVSFIESIFKFIK